MASIDYMRVLQAHGYQIRRTGLQFRVTTNVGLVSYMTVSELADTAAKLEQVIL